MKSFLWAFSGLLTYCVFLPFLMADFFRRRYFRG